MATPKANNRTIQGKSIKKGRVAFNKNENISGSDFGESMRT